MKTTRRVQRSRGRINFGIARAVFHVNSLRPVSVSDPILDASWAAFHPSQTLIPSFPACDGLWMIQRSDSFTDTPIPTGTLVRYDGLVDGGPEFGVVVHCWLDQEIGFHDCYVAFFGTEIPPGEPNAKPYILRYAAITLARLEMSTDKVR